MLVAGPLPGAALFGLGEADDTAMRLQDKGVDAGTAWQVGGVVGAVSALGAALPISALPAGWERTSRNADCPCGSGRKFKHCHGRLI
jgi:uncharacterized protein YecA (UPF0149 family)